MRSFLGALLLVSACTNASSETPKKKAESASSSQGKTASAGRLAAAEVVAKYDGKSITYGELTEAAQQQLQKAKTDYLQEVYSIEKQTLEQMVVQSLVEAKAKAEGKDPGQYMRSLGDDVPDPSDKDVQKFYDARVKRSGRSLEDTKEQIIDYLTRQSKQEAVQGELEKLKKEANVQIDLPKPDLPKANFNTAGRPSKGPKDAKVTLVEFSDFQCPYCSRAVPAVDSLLEQFDDDLRVVFMHFPLSFHKEAMPSAIASECAFKQGKFWEMHDKLFDNQRALAAEKYTEWAQEIGLDMDEFKACQKDPAVRKQVEADMSAGRQAGVNGTPSFYVNGVKTAGGPPNASDIEAAM